jgi:hypothetical protein
VHEHEYENEHGLSSTGTSALRRGTNPLSEAAAPLCISAMDPSPDQGHRMSTQCVDASTTCGERTAEYMSFGRAGRHLR